MSIFFKARGRTSIGILLIRLTLGAYFLTLGIMQANNIESYIARLKAMGDVSENTAFIAGFVLPFVLIVFGGLYIIGFFTPITSSVLSVVTLSKLIARGLFPEEAGLPFNHNLIFLVCTLLTLFAGAGVLSLDVLLDRKKKREIVVEKPAITDVQAPIQNP